MAMTEHPATTDTLLAQSAEFLSYLAEWWQGLPVVQWSDLLAGADVTQVALFSVDMVNGFCHEGALASPRVAALIAPIRDLLMQAHARGVRHFVLPQDTHRHDAVEFQDFPEHCVVGTSQSQTVPELASLPFADLFTIIPKNSLSPAYGTSLDAWLDAHPNLQVAVVTGDCTDLCVYQLAMHLKLRANAANQHLQVVVPANCVQTYDLPVKTARQIGALAHDGDLLHLLFLYHMRLNGIRVVREVRES
jgi:nicotinamidase-related amidase